MWWRLEAPSMDEPGWISFYTAAHLRREEGMGWVEACKVLRVACREELLTSMAAPDDEPGGVLPFEYWKRIAPSEWHQRDVDYDGPDADGCNVVVMLKEYDFNRWRDRQSKSHPRDAVIQKLLKDGRPGRDLTWKAFREKVRKECGAIPTTHGFADE